MGVCTDLLAAIADKPDDWELYLVAGDAAEEAGDEDLARGLRWCGENQKRPHINRFPKSFVDSPWLWWDEEWTAYSRQYCRLPKVLLKSVRSDDGQSHTFTRHETMPDAIRALSKALAATDG